MLHDSQVACAPLDVSEAVPWIAMGLVHVVTTAQTFQAKPSHERLFDPSVKGIGSWNSGSPALVDHCNCNTPCQEGQPEALPVY